MDSVSPVWTEQETELERVIALDQPEYAPLIVLPIRYGDGSQGLSVRFRFTAEEREKIARGADLILTEITQGLFTPVGLEICQPEKRPFE